MPDGAFPRRIRPATSTFFAGMAIRDKRDPVDRYSEVDAMKCKPVLPLLTLAISLSSGTALSQNRHAFDNANDNASFKRCATEHPSPEQAKKLDKEMRSKLEAISAKGKPGGVGLQRESLDVQRCGLRFRPAH